MTDQINTIQAFVGKHADDLGNLISMQIKPLYESLGIVVPVKSVSIVYQLSQTHQASLADLSKALGQSHQLVKQKIPKLLKAGIISADHDPADKRKTLYTLTTLGQQQATLLKQHSLELVYQHLSAEIGADLGQVLTQAIAGLKNKDLLSRFQSINHDKTP